MYSRTQNENGTHNTRCLDCFLTIASSIESDAELEAREARHICPEKALAWLYAHEQVRESVAAAEACVEA
jgi:hypothetical protein